MCGIFGKFTPGQPLDPALCQAQTQGLDLFYDLSKPSLLGTEDDARRRCIL